MLEQVILYFKVKKFIKSHARNLRITNCDNIALRNKIKNTISTIESNK